jgi:hypothetical protein
LIEDVTSRFVASCPVTRSLRKPSRHGQATVESHLCCPRAPKQATVIYAIIPLLRLEEKKNGRSIDDSFARTRLRHLHDSRKQHRVNICACILGTNERPRSASRGSAALAPILGLGVHVGEPPLELTVVGAGPLYVEMVSALPDAVEEPVLALLSGTSNSVSSDKSQVNIMEKKNFSFQHLLFHLLGELMLKILSSSPPDQHYLLQPHTARVSLVLVQWSTGLSPNDQAAGRETSP